MNGKKIYFLFLKLGANNHFVNLFIIHHSQSARPPQVPGLSHLASEYYEVTTADPDNISLDRSDMVVVVVVVVGLVATVVMILVVTMIGLG